jgi:hypothetical protein
MKGGGWRMEELKIEGLMSIASNFSYLLDSVLKFHI